MAFVLDLRRGVGQGRSHVISDGPVMFDWRTLKYKYLVSRPLV